MDGWANIVHTIIPGLISDVVTIFVGFIIIFISVPVVYSVLLFVLFSVSAILMMYAQKQAQNSRTESGKIINELHKKQIQILMSKFEIFQNNKIKYELYFIEKLTTVLTQLTVRANIIIELFNGTAATMMMIVQAGIYIIIGYGVMNGDYEI